MPVDFAQILLASDSTRTGVIFLILYIFARAIEKYVSGWVNNRTKSAEYRRTVDDQWHKYAQGLQLRIEERSERIIGDLKERLLKMEIESDRWKKEAESWHDKYILSTTAREQQRKTVKELEEGVEGLKEQVKKLEEGR